MLFIRKFEEAAGELCLAGKVITPCHLSIGQEAVAVGVCSALTKEDKVFGTHRSHHHYLAKGGDPKKLMAEICCLESGCSGGRGGSMHIMAPEVGFMGTSAIVGGTIPLAVGTALANSLQGNDNVVVAFFGEGAACEGVFYESLNFASLKKLPILFVCENNLYASHMPIHQIHARSAISKKAEAFGMSGACIDGNNIIQVRQTTQWALNKMQTWKGPTLIECETYRHRGHVGPHDDLDKLIRPKEEVEEWMKNDPIKLVEKCLRADEIFAIQSSVEKEIEEVIKFVEGEIK